MNALFMLVLAALPAERIAQLMARSIGYDKALKARAGDKLVVAIVHDGGCADMEKAFAALKGVRVQGVPIEVVAFAHDKTFGEKLKTNAVDVAYVCKGVVAEIAQATRKAKVMTIAANSDDVAKGLTLGVVQEGEKVTLLVNQTAAKAEGVDFNEQLLAIAKVVN